MEVGMAIKGALCGAFRAKGSESAAEADGGRLRQRAGAGGRVIVKSCRPIAHHVTETHSADDLVRIESWTNKVEGRTGRGFERPVDRGGIIHEFMAPAGKQLGHESAFVKAVAALSDHAGKAADRCLILRF